MAVGLKLVGKKQNEEEKNKILLTSCSLGWVEELWCVLLVARGPEESRVGRVLEEKARRRLGKWDAQRDFSWPSHWGSEVGSSHQHMECAKRA